MRTCTIVTLAGCLLLTSLNAHAARKAPAAKSTQKDSIRVSEGTVDKKFQPILEPVERILVLPDPEPQTITKQPMVFSIAESPASLQGEYTPLPAAGIQQTFPAADQLGYVRLGVGSHRAFLGDVQLNLLRKPTQSFDINFSHRSIFGDVLLNTNEEKQARYNDNNLLLSYKLHRTNTEIDASLGERITFWNYYGSAKTAGTDTLNISNGQWSTDGLFKIGLKSKALDEPFSYTLKAEGHLFRLGRGITSPDNSPANEKGGAEHDLSLKGTLGYKLSDLLKLGVDAELRSFRYRAASSYPVDSLNAYSSAALAKAFENRNYFELHPYVGLTYRRWMLTAGLKLSIPSLVTESVHPNIIASALTPLNEKTMLRLSLDGGVEPMSYREGIEMNRYLDPSIRLKSTWKPFDLSAAIDYRPATNIRISPEIGISKTLDAPFFYNAQPGIVGVNNAYGRIFSVEYMTSTQFRIGANGQYSLDNVLTVLGSVQYNSYRNSSKDDAIDAKLEDCGRKAWYKPGLEMHLRADINPMDKLTLYADYRVEGLRYASTPTLFCDQIKSINDLGIGSSYKVSRSVGIFLNVNNLLDQNYEEYNAYPVHGFSAVMGGSVSF
jgi:hypothetical protein